MTRWWTLVGVVLMGIAGCGADCEDLCEEAKDEGCTGSANKNCEAYCIEQDDLAEDSECDDKYDDYLDCADDLDDICDLGNKCKAEGAALYVCESEYCKTHKDTPGC